MRTASGTSIDVKDSILDAVGDTPLVRLSRLGKDLTPQLVAKVEALNPGGSIKDRAAIALIEAAERDGKLRPGGTIVEPTSGNTGTGLAIAAALKGYRVIAVMPDKMSKEKIDLLRAYGAEVVVAPTEVAPDSPESYYRVADRLTEEIPGAFQPNQYKNPANPEAHYRTTGPELWRQSGGQITHLVVGVGTGGTITGVGRYLREQKPDIKIIGADPVGSIYSGGEDGVKPYLVEGVGEDFWPETFDPSIVDRYITVSDRDSFLWTRRLAETEGILAGGSGGLALYAAYQVARELTDPSAMVALILPDGGRSYLSKVFNDAWMRQYGFLEREAEQTVGDVLRRKHAEGEIPPLLTVETHAQVRDAVALLHEHRVSQLPVVSAHDPHTVVGSVSERGLLRHAMDDPALLAADIIEVMEAPFPAIAAEDGVRAGGGAARGQARGAAREHGRARGRHRHACRPARVAGEVTGRRRLATRVVHAGLDPDPSFRSVVPPIHQTSTYVQPSPGEFVEDYDYARSANPTRAALERALGELEGGLASAFSSGMAATHALLTAHCSAGDHVILPQDLYGGTYRLLDKVLSRFGLEYDMVDQTDLDALERALRPETKLIWVETPTNPLLNVVDIAAVVERKQDAIVAVDNTFATPIIQRPLELGADAVVHSATKYLGGHSDVVGGAVVVADEGLNERVRFVQNSVGAVPGPFDCFLVHRGLRTLHLRVAAHTENGRAVSDFLRDAPGVEDVRWPGFGGMVSFRHPEADAHRGRHGDLLARGVARRGRVPDRGAAGDDPPVGGGLVGGRAGRPGAALVRRGGRRGPRGRPAPGAR